MRARERTLAFLHQHLALTRGRAEISSHGARYTEARMKRREIEHYEILKKLGSGGSGVVYLANDTLLMRPVVLKILKRGALTLEQMRTTVLREARLASAIEHPNVCAIYEVGESSDEAYIVMQYVPGRSLDA